MADKVAPVQASSPSTEEIQRKLHGKNYDEIKKKEKELADKAPKVEPQAPWPSTEDVQRSLHGENYDEFKKKEKDAADKAAADKAEADKLAKAAAKPAPAQPVVEQKVTVAEPTHSSYKTREAKADK